MPSAQDFCDRAHFRLNGGDVVAKLDDKIYLTQEYGDDGIAVIDPGVGVEMPRVVALLAHVDGHFVPHPDTP